MKLKVDFNGVNMLVKPKKVKKTTGRKVLRVPALILGGKNQSLRSNKAFADKFYKKKPKRLFYQIGKVDKDIYIFITPEEQADFYTLTLLEGKSSNIYIGSARKYSKKLVGVSNKYTTFTLSPVKVENAKLKGFKLTKYEH